MLLLFPKLVFSAISINIENIPSSIGVDQEFTANIILTCSDCGASYLRGVFFYPESSTSYFGYTQNNANEWINLPGSQASNYFKINEGSWSGQIKFKFDQLKTPGDYFFKVGRYTTNGSSFLTSTPISILVISPTSNLSPSTSPPQTIPSPTESPTATETVIPPTPSPTSTKSIYKINKPKEEDGQLITGVKINIDNQYIHHEDDEVLEFCNGCFCDTVKSIPCGFGDHTIKLTKSGYADWSEQRNFTQGNSFEITPILIKITSSSNPTSTSSPGPTISSTPTQTLTPTKIPTLSLKALLASSSSTISAVLGESTDSGTVSADIFDISSTPTPENKINKLTNYKTPFFIGLFLAVSSGASLYFRHRKD